MDQNTHTDFKKEIKTLLERKKISVSKLSRLADVHQDTIYKYLREESEMSAANLEKIFDVLNGIQN